MKKIVGILARSDQVISGKEYFVVNKDVISMLNNYDVLPLVIVPPGNYDYFEYDINNGPRISNDELKDIITMIDKCDGIILPGGDEFYQYDIDIVKYLYEKNIPTLGICLGMQTIGYTFSGNIVEVPNHKDTNHEIIIDKNSLLYKIVGKDKLVVNSRHRFMINKTDLYKGAYSNDNVLEEIEDKNKKFFMGLQWHPENILNEDQEKIIEYFINSL